MVLLFAVAVMLQELAELKTEHARHKVPLEGPRRITVWLMRQKLSWGDEAARTFPKKSRRALEESRAFKAIRFRTCERQLRNPHFYLPRGSVDAD